MSEEYKNEDNNQEEIPPEVDAPELTITTESDESYLEQPTQEDWGYNKSMEQNYDFIQ